MFRGSIDEPDALRAPAEASDGVIHLAFNHDFSAHLAAIETDRAVMAVLLDALVGSDRPFVFASGVLGKAAPGVVATEDTVIDPATAGSPRILNGDFALGYADQGVRTIAAAFAPTVHGEGDHGFMAGYVTMDRLAGAAGYVGDGSNTWPAVNIADAAALVASASRRRRPARCCTRWRAGRESTGISPRRSAAAPAFRSGPSPRARSPRRRRSSPGSSASSG